MTSFGTIVEANDTQLCNCDYIRNLTMYCFTNFQPAKKQCLGVSSHTAGGSSTGTAGDKEPRAVRQPRPPGLDVVPGREACWDEIEESEAIRKKLTCGTYSKISDSENVNQVASTGFPPIREIRENFENFFQSGKSGENTVFSAKIREKNFKSGKFFKSGYYMAFGVAMRFLFW